jgi:hypothetical protein
VGPNFSLSSGGRNPSALPGVVELDRPGQAHELLGFGCAVQRLRRSSPSEATAGEAADLRQRSDHHPEV